jgi:hypothetical protein
MFHNQNAEQNHNIKTATKPQHKDSYKSSPHKTQIHKFKTAFIKKLTTD